jgi:hypothetical protein
MKDVVTPGPGRCLVGNDTAAEKMISQMKRTALIATLATVGLLTAARAPAEGRLFVGAGYYGNPYYGCAYGDPYWCSPYGGYYGPAFGMGFGGWGGGFHGGGFHGGGHR